MDVGLVCDSCSTLNPMEATTCSRCQAPVALGSGGGGATAPSAAPGPSTAQHASAGRACSACGTPVPPNFRFCGACGTPFDEGIGFEPTVPPAADEIPNDATKPRARASGGQGGQSGKKTMFFSTMQATRAKLVLIKGDGLDGVSFTLAGEDHYAGRADAALCFEEDPFLSPVHANFFYRDGGLVVRDESSVNGVYLRIRGSCPLQMGDRFLVGEQLLEVQPPGSDGTETPSADGTYFFASIHRPSPFRVVQQLRGGDTGLAFCPTGTVVTLGREGNDINFPDDPFISGHHAQVSLADGQLVLTDLNSKNGTFRRIRGEQELAHGDYVFMGQQLLRVEIV
jgi:pSer/pThr/pTyr-binding forkhead associated (FHA) protein